ncbi:DUF6429 family protein [Fodinibius sp.]|uniref:DUF6429 family protein n=1 Tax=Fodinibius sp. TaxID=1872440 RepID=UPI002ACD7845|nr:DUF6429 family protein [Fodinibius sp.]MDZ7659494.1 DUF6429 family protein [Fodinibius sp.]
MEYDKDKVDEVVLALLWLTMFEDKFGTRAWKGHSWEHLDRLYEKGFIDNPKSKAKSVVITEEGEKRSKELFDKYFGIESE